ncbi:MAG: ABC transporter substrate-binding protein [Alphaproteobacteria bacterium]|jgi:peptide/nickel transport system substrate-binding protein
MTSITPICALRVSLTAAAFLTGAAFIDTASALSYVETPSLAADVAAGKLPPVAERLPDTPEMRPMNLVDQTIGRHGGSMTMLMARPKDIRLMVVYGYARLARYNRDMEIVPDILQNIDIEEGRKFTFHLRAGHKWSNGTPFTTEDFRYYWEDVANQDMLSPTGPPAALRVNGKPPKVTIIDATTIQFEWDEPNPAFLPALAGARPLYIYRPSQYLRKYHVRYGDAAKLDAKAKKKGQRNWAALHNKLDHQYKNKNIKLPSLQPWINTTKGASEQYVFKRNPYYHKVDPEGRQLPYIDRVVFRIASSKIIPAKVGTGQADLQARYLRFDNFTFLKRNEQKSGFSTRLWRTGKGAHMALYPNLNAKDKVWRKLLRDVRFRRAISLSINRYELNRVIYFGLALEAQNTALPQSPLFRESYQKAWTKFDIAEANRLLDELGLDKRDDRGIRLLPDGRPMDIIVESTGESSEEADVLELVEDSWSEVGLKLHTKPTQREVMRNRVFAGETIMSISSGLENGLPTPDMDPEDLAPTSQVQYQWPKWGQKHETMGRAGEDIDMPGPKKLMALHGEWLKATTTETREKIWHQMLSIHADKLYSIGLISGVLQPIVVRTALKNVPLEGIYTWMPCAHFGMYEPDSFWFNDTPKPTRQASAN